jgi:hypothetical protein
MVLLKPVRVWRLALTIVLVSLVALWCRPLLLLLFPGILLMHLPYWKQHSLSDLLPRMVATSISFWIVSFWFVPYVRLPLSLWAYAVILLAAFLWGVGVWASRDDVPIALNGQEASALFLLLVAAALRFSFFWRWPLAPAGGDMSMHGYMAALIVAVDTVPSSHQPLLPIDQFGAYPVGFQALTALMSLLGGLPTYRSALLMEATSLSLLTLAFYSFLRTAWDRQASALGALLVTFLPRNPQYFIQWGGDPTLLALALLVVGLGFLPCLRERMPVYAWGVCALIAAASVLTHLIPVIGWLYAAIPVGVYAGYYHISRRQGAIVPILRNIVGIGVISALLLTVCLPALLATEVSAAEVEWVKRFQRDWSGGAWGGALETAAITIPSYLTDKVFGGRFMALSCVGLLALALCRPRLAIASAIWVVTVVGLVINSMYWVLPLSYAIYPERVALLLLLPCALGIGALLEVIRRCWPQRGVMVWIMAAVVLVVAVRENEKLLYKGLIPHTLLTRADLTAMHWIQANTDPQAVFQNRYGDAGLWLPAIASRPITDPHLSPFFFDEFRAGAARLHARYVYVGKKKLLGEPVPLTEFESKPEVYRKVYEGDGVMIYKIIHAGDKS